MQDGRKYSPNTNRPGSVRLNLLGRSRQSIFDLQAPQPREQESKNSDNNNNSSAGDITRSETFSVSSKKTSKPVLIQKDKKVQSEPILKTDCIKKKRRNTAVPRKSKQLRAPTEILLPIKISLQTPNIQRSRQQRATREDLLLRQKKVIQLVFSFFYDLLISNFLNYYLE